MTMGAGSLSQGSGISRKFQSRSMMVGSMRPQRSIWGEVQPREPIVSRVQGSSGEAVVNDALCALPYARQVEVARVAARLPAKADFAICVPAQDEQQFLATSLAALLTAMAGCSEAGVIVLLINNSTDGSWSLAHRFLSASGFGFLMARVTLDPEISDAPHARRLALDIGAHLAPDGVLLTTDADTLVDPDWVSTTFTHIRAGSDLVCGSVSIDPEELRTLPWPVRRCGEVEAAYSADLEKLWQQWTGGTAPGFQIPAMGASLALSVARYRAVGGMPTPPVAEDKALAKLARRHSWSIALASDVRVETSGRLVARAAGGMGDALRARATDDDPFCDEQLVPLGLLRRLADVWNGLPDTADRSARFYDLVDCDPALQHGRMRLSEVSAELEMSQGSRELETLFSGAGV